LSGEAFKNGKFDDYLRRKLGRKKRHRRPAKPGQALTHINSRAVGLAEDLVDWVPGVVEDFKKTKELPARRQIQTYVRESLKGLRRLRTELDAAIKRCESLVKPE